MHSCYRSVTFVPMTRHLQIILSSLRNMKQSAEASVFTRLGRFAVARPKAVLVAAAAFMVVAGMAGNGLVHHLSTGGFDDTGSQATQAQRTLEKVFGQGNPDVVL